MAHPARRNVNSREAKARRMLAIGYTQARVTSDCDLPWTKVQELAAELRSSRIPNRKQGGFAPAAIAELKAEGYSDDAIRAVFGET